MKTLISIDPGMSSAVVVGTYSDTEPYKMTHAFQIEGGVEGFLERVSYGYHSDSFILVVEWPGGSLLAEERELFAFFDCHDDSLEERDDITVICEKFKPRGAGNNFAYRTNDLEPLRVEGAILAMGIKPTWVQPAQQYFASGESKSPVTNAHRWLKANGLHITGKDVGCADANDARSALLHSISYLRRAKHKPTLEKYFPRG